MTQTELAATDQLQEAAPRAIRHFDELSGAVEISSRPNPIQRLRNVWRYRELLGNLVRTELKVKYKNSVLGFVWSMLNPALYIVVFSFVFGILMNNGIRNFALFMMSGLLLWNFFTAAVGAGTTSITGNASLVTKVWFPREVLPIASLGAAFIHFLLQSIVLFVAMLVFRQVPSGTYAVLLIPALLDVVLFTAGLAVLFSALNVYMRDMQHLVELLMLAWFWGTPIVYSATMLPHKLDQHGWPTFFAWFNPLTAPIMVFQRVLYNDGLTLPKLHNPGDQTILINASVLWYLKLLVIVFVGSLLLLWVALIIFGRLEDNMAEEI